MIRSVGPWLRAVLAAPLVLLAISAPAWAATARYPYKIAPTRTCLAQHGAHLLAAKLSYPHQIEWVVGRSAGTPVTILIAFSHDPQLAAMYEQKLMSYYSGERLSTRWIQRHLFLRQNVVVHPEIRTARESATRVATILDCLRR
jgi:hypothetical protein